MTEHTLCENECTHDDGTPRLAEHGRYCVRCWRRLDWPLSQMDDLGTHLIGMIPTTGSQSDDRVTSSKEPPLPLNTAAFDDASELYSMLVYWCMVWADHLNDRAPEIARGAWRRATGTIVGLPHDVGPAKGGAMVGSLARWLRNRLDTILNTVDWADDIEAFTEQLRDVARIDARWPRIPKPEYSKVPCPIQDCGARIAVYPPTFGPWVDVKGTTHPGDDRRIVCQKGHTYTEDTYEHMIEVFKQVRKEQAQVDRTVKHLVKKFGIGA